MCGQPLGSAPSKILKNSKAVDILSRTSVCLVVGLQVVVEGATIRVTLRAIQCSAVQCTEHARARSRVGSAHVAINFQCHDGIGCACSAPCITVKFTVGRLAHMQPVSVVYPLLWGCLKQFLRKRHSRCHRSNRTTMCAIAV